MCGLEPEAKKNVLENLLGILPLAENPPKHRQQGRRKAVVEDSQRLLIVPADAGDQLFRSLFPHHGFGNWTLETGNW
jgi:hypothetical protein